MAGLYATTLFLSAFLVFSIQPLMGRLLLPLLGGVPSVWIACQLFFQTLLLGGYVYAHLGTSRLPRRRQPVVHGTLLVLGALLLPPSLSGARIQALTQGSPPLPWMLLTLALTVGLPFLVLSSSAPLLLRWFSLTRHPQARDPHYLFVASNLGSLLALAAYPFLIEPRLGLRAQAVAWSVGYVGLALLIALCARIAARNPGVAAPAGEGGMGPEPEGIGRRSEVSAWRWGVLAFVPSSLFLGVTQFITTDLASIPLFWVVPLAVYLLTFILAFARRVRAPVKWSRRALPPIAAAVVFVILSRAAEPIWLILTLHLLGLFCAGLLCHGQLAEGRPGPGRLTEFYLCLAAGGALGGLFNAVVAPVVFRSIVEYPLALVLACALRPGAVPDSWRRRAYDLALPILLACVSAATAVMVFSAGLEPAAWRNGLAIGVPLVLAFCFVDRPLRFALGLAAVLLTAWNFARPQGPVIRSERNFFGASRVTAGVTGTFRLLVHGNTLHGRQFTNPQRRCEPLAYYHRSGPVGEIFEWLQANHPGARVAIVGLGAGTMAAYAQPGQDWTFFEIDPAIIEIAQDPACFTFLGQCAGAPWRIVPGDARLRLRAATDPRYALIAVDAFSSDSIPVHLLTREALQIYLGRLADGGLLAFHISNRYVDLEPVLADLAADAGLASRNWDDWDVPERALAEGKETSQWIVLARRPEDLAGLTRRVHWVPLEPRQPPRPWTDDFSDVLGALKWK